MIAFSRHESNKSIILNMLYLIYTGYNKIDLLEIV